MKIIQTLKGIFSKPGNEQSGQNESAPLNPFDVNAYMVNHLLAIEKEAVRFIEKYGLDFNAFLYRPDLDIFIREEILSFRGPEGSNNQFLDNDHWRQKNPLNFPGPFYTGESDTCGTGNPEAPHNVLSDWNACEYIFRQPRSYSEFLCVIDAAAVEVLDSYSCNGNHYWTYRKCKVWWEQKPRLVSSLDKRCDIEYIDYLNGAAETDLRKYCYFLENGVYPTYETKNLPEL